jgi:FemAB-related protein (PEP-CTERM system-associated)
MLPTSHIDIQPYAGNRDEWDSFVRATPGGTFFHQIGWKEVMEGVFGFAAHYLEARQGATLTGVLPLFEIRSPLGGSALLSLPFAVEGGICASTVPAQRALEAAACQLARDRRARQLELRDGLEAEGFHAREGTYFGFRRAIFATDEENMAAIRRKQRRMIRVGQQSGLISRVGMEDLDAFHDLYARSVRQLGTPVFSRRYFRQLAETFGDRCLLLTVWKDTVPVAGVLSFVFGDRILPYYAGSRREYFRYAVNDFMYWELMRRARESGLREFDFGRSKKGTGAFDFKCHWGFEPQPLRYRVYLPNGGRLRERTASSSNVQLLRQAWSRLPLGVTKLVGPFFIRRFGAYYT